MEELLVVRVTNLLASDRVQVVLLWGTNDAQNNVHLVQVCWWSVVKEHTHTHTHTHTLVHSTHTKNIMILLAIITLTVTRAFGTAHG